MPRAPPPDAELSLSGINRLLRPLRNKCASLSAGTAASADAYTRSRITEYARATGKGGEWAEDDLPPLATFDDPKKLSGRALDRRSMMNMPSCKLVHDVVEAWRNTLQKALPPSSTARSECRIQPLTSICAAIVGRSMVGDMAERPDEEDSGSEDEESDEEGAEMAATQKLYEAVPTRFRSWTLISHSLTLLLSACPHNPTLLSCLLDLALSRRLVQESRSILSALLTLSVQPASANMAPPLAHPSHTEFLKDLCSHWTATSSPAPPVTPHTLVEVKNADPHFSKATFVAIFISALIDTQCHEAWTCKATARFARQLRQTDPHHYATLCAGLMSALTRATPSSDDDRPERLALWLDSLPEQCYLAGDDAHTSTMRLLCAAQTAGLQSIDAARLAVDSPMRMLQNALLCTAIRCLSTTSSTSTDHMLESVVALLRSTPSTATLDNVVGPCFDIATSHTVEFPSDSIALADTLNTIIHRLGVFASALREQSLARTEMSLWACALRHYQRLKLPEGSNSRVSAAFRQALVDARTAAGARRAAEEAELERIRLQRRLPSPPRPLSPVSAPVQMPDKPRRSLGSVTAVPVHRPMRFQSASTTTSPVTTPKKPRAATRRDPPSPRQTKPHPKPSKTNSLLLASLNTVSLKLLERGSSDECADEPVVDLTPRPPQAARLRRARRPAHGSDSGSDWGRDHGGRGTKSQRTIAIPHARQPDMANSSDAEDRPRPLGKRKRGAATPRARASRASVYAESSASELEESGSDWGREQDARTAKKTRSAAPSRSRYRQSGEESDSGSDWERDRRARPRENHRAGGSAPTQRKTRARIPLKGRASDVAPPSSESVESDDSSSPAKSPILFKSLLAEAARRRISLRDEPASSPRVVRRRRIVLDSEDESGLGEPMHDSDSDIEIVVDVPVKNGVPAAGAGDDLDLFMYE